MQQALMNLIRALLIVSYLSYYEVHHGNPAGRETMEICTGLIQVMSCFFYWHWLSAVM